MNTAITLKMVLLVLIGLASIASLGFGILSLLAGGMSDSPGAARDAEKSGMFLMAVGAIGIFLCIILAVFA